MSDDARVRRLSDMFDIQNVKARYCHAADDLPDRTAEAERMLREVFAEDATADYGKGLLQGREAIVGFLITAIPPERAWLQHSIHTPLIDVAGETAEASWTIFALMRARGSDAVVRAVGRYQDSFRRTAEGWQIATMRWVEEVVLP